MKRSIPARFMSDKGHPIAVSRSFHYFAGENHSRFQSRFMAVSGRAISFLISSL